MPIKKKFYVYRITNTLIRKHYYGTRSCLVDPTFDLGIVYFSSSSDKSFINEQHNYPENFKYKIVSMHRTFKEALEKEIKIHKRFDVGSNTNFYNKARQTSTGFTTHGTDSSKRVKNRIKNNNGVYSPSYVPTDCIYCSKTYRNTRYHEKYCRMNPNRQYIVNDTVRCVYCSEEYMSKGVHNHERICTSNPNKVDNINICECDYCDRAFNNKKGKVLHEKLCSSNPNRETKRYACSCGYSTTTQSSLTLHERKYCENK